MPTVKFARVRKTDFGTSSQPAMSGLDHLSASQAAAAANHDAWVSDLSPATLKAIRDDLCARHAWDKKDPVQRWTMDRRAAVLRRMLKLNLI